MGKYRPAVILTLALTVFLASCKGTCDDPKSWVVRTLAGIVENPPGRDDTWGFANGLGTAAQFAAPYGVAVDSSGNVYVADTHRHTIRKIEKVWRAGWKATAIAGTGTAGSANGVGTEATFNSPEGVAVDSSDNLYVADTGNHLIRKIVVANDGTATVSTVAGDDTKSFKDRFFFPVGVAVDSSDNLYVADTENNRIRKITSAGVGSTLAGSGTAEEFEFNPHGIAVDSSDNLYVADKANNRIRKITSAGVVTTGVVTSTPVGEKQFYHPEGVAVDSSDNVYVADTGNNLIRKITFTTSNDVITATVSTIAGTGTATAVGVDPDGTGTAATFNNPTGVAVDSSDNLYVADYGNNRIRKIAISSAGVVGAVSTIAGTGIAGHHDGPGTVTRFNNPTDVAVDSSGNLYVADYGNNRIRKIEYR